MQNVKKTLQQNAAHSTGNFLIRKTYVIHSQWGIIIGWGGGVITINLNRFQIQPAATM